MGNGAKEPSGAPTHYTACGRRRRKQRPENRGMIPKDLWRQGRISLPILPENSGDFRSCQTAATLARGNSVGAVEERVEQVHLPAPMGTCVPLTGGISITGGVCEREYRQDKILLLFPSSK